MYMWLGASGPLRPSGFLWKRWRTRRFTARFWAASDAVTLAGGRPYHSHRGARLKSPRFVVERSCKGDIDRGKDIDVDKDIAPDMAVSITLWAL